MRQEDVLFRGHAFECRINAEDVPTTGSSRRRGRSPPTASRPGPACGSTRGRGGLEILALYDPMVAKLIVWDSDRERARRRMLRALEEFVVEGVTTLIPFHRALLPHPCFVDGGTCHGVVESDELARAAAELAGPRRGGPRERPRAGPLAGGRDRRAPLRRDAARARAAARGARAAAAGEREAGVAHGSGTEAVVSPMQGTVLAVEVADGDEVLAGRVLCVDRGDEDGERDPRPPRRDRLRSGVEEGEPIRTGDLICIVATGPGA